MENIQSAVLIVHTLIALGIIGLVLLQRGKGADAGAAFGAGASGTVFGSRGTTSFFSRVTAILATLFFVTSLTLAYISSQRSTVPESLLESAPAAEAEPVTVPGEVEELPELPQLDDGEATEGEPEAAVTDDDAPDADVESPAEEQ